jgi:predicted dehydrogenase
MRSLQGVDAIQVVAVADIIRERAEETAKRWGIPQVFEDYHDILEMDEVEAVNVTTFNQAHRAPTVDALRAGKHVLVEKPMAATLEDAVAMTKAAHETDKILMVALKARYSDTRIAAQRIADSGALGDIYYSESVAARRCGIPGGSFIRKDSAGIGTVADIGVYSLDAALCIMGHPKPVAVSGIANNILGTQYCKPVMGSWKWDPELLEVEDFGVASVRFENGALMTFKTSWIMHMDSLGSTFFLGTKAGLKLNPLTIYRHEWNILTDTVIQNVRETEPQEQFRRENVAFAEAIRENMPSPIPPEQMLLTNVIIQGLIDSTAAGSEVQVRVPDV